jgi:hypothetical protein
MVVVVVVVVAEALVGVGVGFACRVARHVIFHGFGNSRLALSPPPHPSPIPPTARTLASLIDFSEWFNSR